MAQVVEADVTQALLAQEPLEGLGDPVRQQAAAALAGEDEVAVGGVPGVAPLDALGVLAEAVLEQGAQGAGVELDAAVLAGLGLHLGEVGAGRGADELPADGDHAALEVDVVPAQAAGLAASEAGGGDDLEHDAEAVVHGVVEEGPELGGLPWPDLRLLRR